MSFGQLVRYINKPEKKGRLEILHNLVVNGDENNLNRLNTIEEEFLQNQKYAPLRKNGVDMYHKVLSLSTYDQEKVTEEILLDMGQKFLEMRAPKAIVYGRVHFDKGNPHLHLMISGNEISSKKKAWVYKSKLKHIKQELEAYQREQYPQLENSRVKHGAKSAEEKARKPVLQGRGRGEREGHRRHQGGGGGQSEKERVFAVVQEVLRGGVRGEAEIVERLERAGFSLYRRGNTVGVLDTGTKKKYRLKTLGLAEAYEQAIERGRMYAEVLVAKSCKRVRALGVAADVLRVVNRVEIVNTFGLDVKEKKKCVVDEMARREESWREVLRQKRERRWGMVRGR